MLQLQCGEFEISVFNHPEYLSGPRFCKRETCLSDDDWHLASNHAVVVKQGDEEIASHLLATDGGATGVHNHSALIHESHLLIAVGNRLCALQIPSLNLVWNTEVDWATCFGVHLSPCRDFLISHGELSISRLDFHGNIEWQSSGADIFTGEFKTFENHIEVVDWNGDRYRFEIEDGKSNIM